MMQCAVLPDLGRSGISSLAGSLISAIVDQCSCFRDVMTRTEVFSVAVTRMCCVVM